MSTRINLITSVLFIFMGLSTAYAKPELQRAEVGQLKPVSSRIFLNSEVTEVSIGNLDKLDLRLKWAVVSGDLNSSKDRIRVRLRCNNNEKWIDLYARRNATGQFDQKVVYLRAFGNDDPELPDLRIVHWSHERLWIKLSKVEPQKADTLDEQLKITEPSTPTPLTKTRKSSDSYFEFDLTK